MERGDGTLHWASIAARGLAEGRNGNNKMENEERKVVDLYIPRKCSATNRIIGPRDFASVQLNIVDVDADGRALRSHQTFCLCGRVRAQGHGDSELNRLFYKKGLLSFSK